MTRNLLALALLTSAIGMPAAFFTIALPAVMRDGGASLFQIGLVYIIWLPSALKWLWAPWFETMPRRPFGSRFGWMRAIVLAIALAFLPTLLLVEQMNVWGLVALALVTAALSVTLQLVVASWLMSAFDEKGRATANGVAIAGMVAGGVFGGGFLPLLATWIGWPLAVGLTSLLIATAALGTYGLQPVKDEPNPDSTSIRDFVTAFRRIAASPSSPALLSTLTLLAFAGGADSTIPARLIDAGYDPVQTGMLLGTVATVAMIPAAGLAGRAIRQWGGRTVLAALAATKGAILLALAFTTGAQLVALLSVLDFVVAGGMTVAIWQVYMGHAAPSERPVTTYGCLSALDASLRLVAGIGAGALGTLLGFPTLFILGGLLTIAAAIAASRMSAA